ncbi:ORF119 [Ranid herpesvirus 1]|uniref:ORF119 n=1 Tax=Ranid herpesvirus 1 TaxID=85655 RepID=Q14VL1_9VIRU|nr:ORF119 [Ranid herpesvirus 1]ABG25715.1 ORF119 [Ranid herpesvirus 1]
MECPLVDIIELGLTGILCAPGHRYNNTPTGRVRFFIEQDEYGNLFYVHDDTPCGAVVSDAIQIDASGVATLQLGPGRQFHTPDGRTFPSQEELFRTRIRLDVQPGASYSGPVTLQWRIHSTASFFVVPLLLWWTPFCITPGFFARHAAPYLFPQQGCARLCSGIELRKCWAQMCHLHTNEYTTPDPDQADDPAAMNATHTSTICDTTNPRPGTRCHRDQEAQLRAEMSIATSQPYLMGTHCWGARYVRPLDFLSPYVLFHERMHLLPNVRMPRSAACQTLQMKGMAPTIMMWDMMRYGYTCDTASQFAVEVGQFYGVSRAHHFKDAWTFTSSRSGSWHELQEYSNKTLPRITAAPAHHMYVEHNCHQVASHTPHSKYVCGTENMWVRAGDPTSPLEHVLHCCACGSLTLEAPCQPTPHAPDLLSTELQRLQSLCPLETYNLCVELYKRHTLRRDGYTLSDLTNGTEPLHVVKTFADAFCTKCELGTRALFMKELVESLLKLPPVINMVLNRTAVEQDAFCLHNATNHAPIQYTEWGRRAMRRDAFCVVDVTPTTRLSRSRGLSFIQLHRGTPMVVSRFSFPRPEPHDEPLLVERCTQRIQTLIRRGSWWELARQPYAVQRMAADCLVLDPEPLRRAVNRLCTKECVHHTPGAQPVATHRDGWLCMFEHRIAPQSGTQIRPNGCLACFDVKSVRVPLTFRTTLALLQSARRHRSPSSKVLHALLRLETALERLKGARGTYPHEADPQSVCWHIMRHIDDNGTTYTHPRIWIGLLLLCPHVPQTLLELCRVAHSTSLVYGSVADYFYQPFRLLSGQNSTQNMAPSARRWLMAKCGMLALPPEPPPDVYNYPPALYEFVMWCYQTGAEHTNTIQCCVCLCADDEEGQQNMRIKVLQCYHYVCTLCYARLRTNPPRYCPQCRHPF